MSGQSENIKGMRMKIKAQADHIRNLEKIIADSRTAPVPPAGDAEVQTVGRVWHLLDGAVSAVLNSAGRDLPDDEPLVSRSSHLAIVTRLTAEHDGLLGNCADLSSRVRELEHKMDYWKTQNAALQSELTKARECITKIAMWPDGGNAYGQDKIKAFANRILSGTELHKATEIAHQSAPAAKVCKQPQAHPARCGCEQE